MTQKILEINAELREKLGSNASRAVRRSGKVPAVIYGGNEEQVYISLVENDVHKLRLKHNIMSHMFDIKVGSKTHQVLPKEIQYHPVTDKITHIDFINVKDDSSVKTSVRVSIINKEKSPGIKLNGTLNKILRSIEVVCHPRIIPEYLEVDIAELKVGQSIHLSDVKLPEGMKLVPKKQDLAIVSITSNRDTISEAKPQGGK